MTRRFLVDSLLAAVVIPPYLADLDQRRRDMSTNTWETRDPLTGRHHRNGHLIELHELAWVCLICHHHFDAAVDAHLFACGGQCVHPGESA